MKKIFIKFSLYLTCLLLCIGLIEFKISRDISKGPASVNQAGQVSNVPEACAQPACSATTRACSWTDWYCACGAEPSGSSNGFAATFCLKCENGQITQVGAPEGQWIRVGDNTTCPSLAQRPTMAQMGHGQTGTVTLYDRWQ